MSHLVHLFLHYKHRPRQTNMTLKTLSQRADDKRNSQKEKKNKKKRPFNVWSCWLLWAQLPRGNSDSSTNYITVINKYIVPQNQPLTLCVAAKSQPVGPLCLSYHMLMPLINIKRDQLLHNTFSRSLHGITFALQTHEIFANIGSGNLLLSHVLVTISFVSKY